MKSEAPLHISPAVILIAERNRRIRALLEKVFRNLGYSVLAAGNGHEAGSMLRNSVRCGEPVSLMVLDPDLPHLGCVLRAASEQSGGTDGYADLVPVVMHSMSLDDDGPYIRMYPRPKLVTVTKDADPAELIQTVRSILSGNAKRETANDQT